MDNWKEKPPEPLVVFVIDRQRYALRLSAVQRAIRAIAVTPLPDAPVVVIGVINLTGVILPVVDVRTRFARAIRSIRLSDHLLIVNTGSRTVALLVDEVVGTLEVANDQWTPGDAIVPGLGSVEGAVAVEGGLILIHDLARLLSLDDEVALDQALAEAQARASAGAGVIVHDRRPGSV